MELFSRDEEYNYLPYDGCVHYYGRVVDSLVYYQELLDQIEWKNDEAFIFGKRIITKRKVAWYGDESYAYTYSKVTKQALLWTPALVALKNIAEEKCRNQFNSCLLNLYHSGEEGMAWHSDGEKELVKHGVIASMSIGADRKFSFKHKDTKEVISIVLQSGSLLTMKDQTQDHWLHRLPPTKKVIMPRINLTFRQMHS
ncbi:MAG: alpha-ketoglutarate-dependent dioxygenase AlkB [Flammeovirgaceae bacterium]|jgi:alkylated DNA repair dioxygenase AlkB|nr:alpha-ketoglutarate-dependent dioxygenase AlkB [Flammeovirgaceae bacterium]|tara:strand:- start:67247 stop:67840 length:594 start_codon:yes stop_codon:yes gene_type:complete